MERRWLFVGGLVVFTLSLFTVFSIADPSACANSRAEAETGPRFTAASGDVGFNYTVDRAGERIGGSGVYVTDVDRDTWPDVFVTGGTAPVLFENTDGKFVKSEEFPTIEREVEGAVFFDHDGDGWEDLVLLSVGRKPLFLHNGRGEFIRKDVGFEETLVRPIGATVADYDGDGDEDLFVIQYGEWTENTPAGYRDPGPVDEDNGHLNVLYENTPDGLERVTDAGISGQHWSLAASFVDLTGDDRPDIHVANDFNRDVVYVNRGNGTFERERLDARTNRNAMSSEVADVTGDGRLDVFVTNIYNQGSSGSERAVNMLPVRARARGNNLLVNGGNGTFVDRAKRYGVQRGGWGWAAVLTDLDNDMDDDLFHTTQILSRVEGDGTSGYASPQLWERGHREYESVSATRAGFDETDGRGAAELDFDLDGDMDLVVAVKNGAYVLYENTHDEGNAVEVVVDPAGDRKTALGTELYVTTANQSQYEVRNSKADFQSQDTRMAHFGVGDAEEATVRVVWPDGTERRWQVESGQRLVVDRDGIHRRRSLAQPAAPLSTRLITSVSELLSGATPARQECTN